MLITFFKTTFNSFKETSESEKSFLTVIETVRKFVDS